MLFSNIRYPRFIIFYDPLFMIQDTCSEQHIRPIQRVPNHFLGFPFGILKGAMSLVVHTGCGPEGHVRVRCVRSKKVEQLPIDKPPPEHYLPLPSKSFTWVCWAKCIHQDTFDGHGLGAVHSGLQYYFPHSCSFIYTCASALCLGHFTSCICFLCMYAETFLVGWLGLYRISGGFEATPVFASGFPFLGLWAFLFKKTTA